MEWIFCSIDDSRVIRENFDCGVPELNQYLKKYARQNQRKGIAKTWVAIPQDGDGQVAGYYSISMAELQLELLPENYRKGLPRYPLPVMRIGKLAVTQSMQGKKLGETLLVDAFNRVIRLSEDIAVLKKVRYAHGGHGGLCPRRPMPYAQSYLIFLRKAI
ncbi:GNAT family N-acetyltransferase [Microcoleus sp. POL10_C6]|uniref:GNAT family N-acetyltransferase n=1 Tax=Microcoleus sp. POL10_C6 TaxID=2818852 RepID=UPI002FD17508